MQKLIYTLLVAGFTFVSCNNKGTSSDSYDSTLTASVDVADAPILHFEQNSYDFGKINEGDKVTREFKFTNQGKTPLIISNATATCGCTIPEYPKYPVGPGKSGVIKVVFNSAGKVGVQRKIVTITSNANPVTSEVYLLGDVKASVSKNKTK